MTCGHDDDWCTSNEYADGCITDQPSFAGAFSEHTITECLMEPMEYLKEVCRGIVTSEGGQMPTGTPSFSTQNTALDSVTVSTPPPSASTYMEEETPVVPVDSGVETEGSTMQMDSSETTNQGVDSSSEAETPAPEDSLAASPSSASIHACVTTFMMMSTAAYCVFYV